MIESLRHVRIRSCPDSPRRIRKVADPFELAEPKTFSAAVGSFEARTSICPDVVLNRKRLPTSLMVVPDLTEELILGVDFFQRWHIRLDPRRHRVLLDPRALGLRAVASRHRPR